MHRRLIFFAVLLALPVVVLAAIEGALRLAGLGGYPPTFVEPGRLDDGSRLVFTDARGPGSYFFASRSQGLALDPVPLVDPKPAGTVRIVWVGGSAAKGIPQERPLRASAFLEEMLADLWPGRDVEVINIGVPGIASYPVLGVMTEALDYDPDLVVAYLGNNEFYGAYGVASLHAAGRSPAMIRLTRAVRSTAIAQGFDRLLRGKNTVPARDLMEAMVADASIAPDSPMRDAAADTLEAFVGDMIDRCHARDVPTIVCPPPCNESGMAPLGVADLSALDAPSRSAVESALARAHDLLATDAPAAESELHAVLERAPDHATAHHLLGRALRAQGRNEEAASEFRLAVDLDPMPWRPPTSSIEAIRRAARAHGAVLADLVEAFRVHSEVGSPGWTLISDHVHPSLRGQALVARTVARAMTELDAPLAVDADAVAALPDWQTYADRRGANPYARYAVAHRMRLLGTVGFFARSNPEMSPDAAAVCAQIESTQPAPIVRRLRAWADPEGRLVDDVPVTGLVAETLLVTGRVEPAEPLFRFAAEASTPYGSRALAYWYYTLVCRHEMHAGLSEDDQHLAREMIRRAEFLVRSGHADSGQGERFAGQLRQLLGEFDASIPDLLRARSKSDDAHAVPIDEALVIAYLQTGQLERARAVIEQGMLGPHADSYRAMLRHF